MKIPFLTRLLEIKEKQLYIESTKILMLDKLCKKFLKEIDYKILQKEINEIWELKK